MLPKTAIDFSNTYALPFLATFGRTEREAAAAYLVLTSQETNTWDPIFPKMVGEAVKKYRDRFLWLRNPFYYPDFLDLIKRGFAEFVGPEEDGLKRAIQFTPLGLSRILTRRIP